MSEEPDGARPRRRLRWYQFSLAAIFVAVAVLCGFLAYWSKPPKPVPVAAQPLLTDTDQDWRVALLKPTQIEFNEQPLNYVMEYLAELHSINILMDGTALQKANVELDAPVSLVLKGVSLRSGLRQILRPLGLDYTVDNDVLLITTQAVADRLQITRVYAIQDLVDEGSSESLLQAIRLELEPPADAVAPAGGVAAPAGPAVPPPEATLHGGLLILRGAYRHHERVQDLLDRMRLNFGATPSSETQGQTGPKQPAPVPKKQAPIRG